jgi:hypothetical protein
MQHLNVACPRMASIPQLAVPSVRFYRSYHVGSSVLSLRTIEVREVDLGSSRRLPAGRTIRYRRLGVFAIWTFRILTITLVSFVLQLIGRVAAIRGS